MAVRSRKPCRWAIAIFAWYSIVEVHFVLFACLSELSFASGRKPLEKPILRVGSESRGAAIEFLPEQGNFLITYTGGRTIYEPPTKVDAIVEVDVGYDSSSRMFVYRYRLVSLPTSIQRVDWFALEFEGGISDVAVPVDWSANPIQWVSAMAWSYRSAKQPRGLQPGQTLEGIGFRASDQSSASDYIGKRNNLVLVFHHPGSVPGLVRCFAKGDAPDRTFDVEVPDIRLPSGVEDTVQGWTVGPVALPQRYDPGAYAEEMSSRLGRYTVEADKQGWIAASGSRDDYGRQIAVIREMVKKRLWKEGGPC